MPIQFPISKPTLSVVDLFAGCGGLSLGLEQAGFSPVFVNELNADALGTYTANRLHSNPHLAEAGFHINDVKHMVRDKKFLPALSKRLLETFSIDKGELDLLVGGPPCQGFSGIGHRRSYSVDKEQLPSNHLFEDMAYVIHRLQPRAFVFENVRGLLNAKWTSTGVKGEIFKDVLATLSGIRGYRVAWRLVYAKDYGVPQNRPRVLVVGIRNDVKVSGDDNSAADAVARGFLPAPISERPPSIKQLLGDLVDSIYVPGLSETVNYPAVATCAVQKMLRTSEDGSRIAGRGDLLTEHEYSKHAPRVVAKFRAMIADPNHKIPKKFQTKKFAQRVLPAEWGCGDPPKSGPLVVLVCVRWTPETGQVGSLTQSQWNDPHVKKTTPAQSRIESPSRLGGLERHRAGSCHRGEVRGASGSGEPVEEGGGRAAA